MIENIKLKYAIPTGIASKQACNIIRFLGRWGAVCSVIELFLQSSGLQDNRSESMKKTTNHKENKNLTKKMLS